MTVAECLDQLRPMLRAIRWEAAAENCLLALEESINEAALAEWAGGDIVRLSDWLSMTDGEPQRWGYNRRCIRCSFGCGRRPARWRWLVSEHMRRLDAWLEKARDQ